MPGRLRTGLAAVMAVAALLSHATATAQAQTSASLDIATRNRYRGTDLGSPGAVVRTGLQADATGPLLEGAYANVSAAWRAGGGGLETAETLLGWSRRLSTVDARWGWDVGVHTLHYAGASRLDFHEFMAGLLAPGWSTRVWWSPHYFGGAASSWYAEVDRSIDLADGWRVFGHAGMLRYGHEGPGPSRPARIDGLVGVGHATGRWDLRLTVDGRADNGSHAGPAWTLAAGVAF